MDAVYYLERLEKIDRLIENKLAESEFWRTVATGVTVSVPTAIVNGETVGMEKVKSSSTTSDKMAEAVANYVDIEEAYKLELGALAEEKREIIHTIEMLPFVEYDVIYRIYVEHKSTQEVADAIDKSRSWVAATHNKAVANLQKILDAVEL